MAVEEFEDFDPFDPEQAGRHHEVMAELRSRYPAARLPSDMIAVSRYEDVRAALNLPTMRNRQAARAPGIDVPPDDRLFFFEYDPPEHTVLRRLLVDLLSRARSEGRAPAIRALVEGLLGRSWFLAGRTWSRISACLWPGEQ
ncbi:MAG TPA: hypothetical protein VLX59_12340 [Acidimicrobiales bacterium]|nr:hypothetical protein [Acidimicrobiales bacterium]